MTMHWILQLNLERGEREAGLKAALETLQIPHTIVKIVPFTHELIPDPAPTGKVVAYGSTALRLIALRRGWSPGFYWNDTTFSFSAWNDHWGLEMLNHDARVCRFADVTHEWDEFFIRPCDGDKTFAGKVLHWEDFVPWRERVLNGQVSQYCPGLCGDTPVAVGPARTIQEEFRFFIAAGRIVTASLYRRNGQSAIHPFPGNHAASTDITRYVESRIETWQPHCAFVLDIARLADGSLKIIEVNCYNAAGLYACDPHKLIQALEALETEDSQNHPDADPDSRPTI